MSEYNYSWLNPHEPQKGAEQQSQNTDQQTSGAGQQIQNAGQQTQSMGWQMQSAGQQAQSAGWQNQSTGQQTQNAGWQSRSAEQQTQNAGWQAQGGVYNWQASAPTKKKRVKNRRNRRGWGTVVAMALVFGLIAGGVTYGVNFAANKIRPIQTSSAEQTQNTPVLQVGNTGAETADSETPANSGSSSGELSVAEVAANVMPSMVTISTMSVQEMQSFFGGTQKFETPGAGTGFIISQTESELLIATNNHVISNATEVSVGFVDESVASASIKGQDPTVDIAVIAVKMSNISEETIGKIRVAALGDSDQLVLGEQVVAIGNALGYGQSVTSGYISGFDRELMLTDGTTSFTATGLIQTDAAINSGNSGGALVNMSGEVIGINEAKSSKTSSGTTVDNVGYVIPMAKALPILQELMSQETKEILSEEDQGYLGVTCADVTSEYAQMYDMPQGVCFTSVVENGPAAMAGVKKGDVLVKFDGQAITDFNSLTNKMRYYAAGDTVEILVMRANEGEYKEVPLTVKLGTQSVIQGIGAPEDDG